MPTTSYIVAATPRSGSTLLCDALARTGVAGVPREAFEVRVDTGLRPQPRDYFADLDDPGLGGLLPERRTDGVHPSGGLPAVVAEGTTPNGVFGAKVMWGHLPTVFHLLGADGGVAAVERALPGLRWVRIRRADRARQAISLWRAIQSGSWRAGEAGGGEPVYSGPAIDHLHARLAVHDARWDAFLAAAATPPLELVYEDVAADLEGAVRAVLAHVGVDAPAGLAVRAGLERQADERTEAWLARYVQERSA